MELLNWVGRYFTQGRNKIYQVAGGMGGGLVSIHFLDIHTPAGIIAGVELAIKWLITIVAAYLTGLVTKSGADTWSEYIKPKIKFLNNGKGESERQKRA